MIKQVCDICKNEEIGTDNFTFRGHTFSNKNYNYTNKDICFYCQSKMRDVLGI